MMMDANAAMKIKEKPLKKLLLLDIYYYETECC